MGTIVVTQEVSRVFGGAMDKKVDRVHLQTSAMDAFIERGMTNGVAFKVDGLQVERVTYLTNDLIEAVFSYKRKE